MLDRRLSCERGDELAGLALGALDPVQRETMGAHLRACPECARETADLRQVASQLGMAVPQHDPPPLLGQRIFAEARRDLPIGPAGSTHAKPSKMDEGDPISISSRRGVSLPQSRLTLATLAAAVVALLWGASLHSQLTATQRQLSDTSAQLERIRGNYSSVVRVLGSPQSEVLDLQAREGAPGAEGRLWIDRASGQGMLMARNLPPVPAGQTYQVWLANSDTRVSPGFLYPSEDGTYYLVLQTPGRVTDYQRLGVTLEPAGGSPGPTGARIIGTEI